MTARLVIRYHWRMASTSTPRVDSDIADRVSSLAQQIATKVHEVLGDETRVIWFGSWVKGQARPHSYIDLAIVASTPLPTGALANPARSGTAIERHTTLGSWEFRSGGSATVLLAP